MRRPFLSGRAVLAALLLALILPGCGLGSGKRLSLDYRPQGGVQLAPGTVQLLVADRRTSKNLVGPEASSKDLLKESQGGQLDMTTTLPTGSTISLSRLSVEAAVFEAVKNKLQTLGIAAIPDTSGAKARVTVYITEFVIDVEGSDFVGRVGLRGVIDRPGLTQTYNTTASSQGSKFKLVGDMGSNEPMSDALNKAVNSLDFSGLNSY
ncbi:MAG: YajG family lipoprotein [Deltaproteobacteria bacterium]|jgi:hypothetical protein|nr:YajG family lipoprotein [Deltaproteobacteria bacterium]